jgi:hypothetical protein
MGQTANLSALQPHSMYVYFTAQLLNIHHHLRTSRGEASTIAAAGMLIVGILHS